MPSTIPYFREAGSGCGIVCIHSNASNSAQWRDLMVRFSDSYHVLAPDSFGSGKSPDWGSQLEITLGDEVRFIEPVRSKAGSPHILVGHSYGAAIALTAALENPERVEALVLFEPTLFSLVDAHDSSSANGVQGIRQAVQSASMALDKGNKDEAAAHFIDYWMGPGSWDLTPSQRRPAIADSVVNVRRWAHALFMDPTPVQAFGALKMPILYMLGESSPFSAHAVSEVLIPVLPHVEVVKLQGVGHMAPITHPEMVNETIAKFLQKIESMVI